MRKELTVLIFFVQTLSAIAGDTDIITHRIASPFQKDSTSLRVLLPDIIVPGKTYKVLYVLPVLEMDNLRLGDGLKEVMKYDFHNKYNLICVAPEFTSVPWYADHSENMDQQDESHIIKTVIPFIDDHYPTLKSSEGRLLIGFSKCGLGALTLLIRNPEIFHRAAGWDIAIRTETGPISEEEKASRIARNYGSTANFEKYKLSTLLEEPGDKLGEEARLFYYNQEGNRGPGGAEIHNLMVWLKIPHRYLYEPQRPHRWDSGWIPEAVRFLMDDY